MLRVPKRRRDEAQPPAPSSIFDLIRFGAQKQPPEEDQMEDGAERRRTGLSRQGTTRCRLPRLRRWCLLSGLGFRGLGLGVRAFPEP
jgi:hypothetical protein